MITRGSFIGKIVDDFASLKYQVETRNKLQLFDLTRFCEDFFKDLLNIVYNLRLTNLNAERSNNPGIDLGDTREPIAFQITSTKTSQKVNDTLTAVTAAQVTTYRNINIFIIGEKQGTYSITPALVQKVNFDENKNIRDIDDLLRDIVVLPTDKLKEVYDFFVREFRQLKIEFEPVDAEGNFESSIYANLEIKPTKPPLNARKLGDYLDGEVVSLENLTELYSRLSKIPKSTRELIAVIGDLGETKKLNYGTHDWAIMPRKLQNYLWSLSNSELDAELLILEDADLIYHGDTFVGDKSNVPFIGLPGYPLNSLIHWAKEKNIPLRQLFNTMDFTILDEH